MVCPPLCVSLPAFALEPLGQPKANLVFIWMCADFTKPQDEATLKLLLVSEKEGEATQPVAACSVMNLSQF